MQRGAFTAAIVAGAGVPALALGFALSRPGVRALVHDFLSPGSDIAVPTSAPTVAPVLERDHAERSNGTESPALRALRGSDAGAPTTRVGRDALFPSYSAAGPSPGPAQHSRGLRRSELASRDDESVDRMVRYLATDERGHGALLAAVKGSGHYRDAIERILRAWNVPQELSAVAFVESGFSPTHTQGDGCLGLWSLPREVAHAYGLAMLDSYDERRSVALSTEVAAHYLADLRERFGSWELALVAFGVGYRTVAAVVTNSKATDYWDMLGELPPLGTTYVAQVLAVSTMLDNTGTFGLDVVRPDPPETTGDLEVPGGAPFAAIAQAAGTTVARLKELNPEYLREVVPATGFVMVMHVPSAGLAAAQEGLWPLLTSGAWSRDSQFDSAHRRPDAGVDAGPAVAVVVPSGESRQVFYRVQEGDTLESIAGRFGLPREAIIGDNALDPAAGLKPGQRLLLRVDANKNPRPPKP
jgi:membrane-bound lytic murein transglycosylase D